MALAWKGLLFGKALLSIDFSHLLLQYLLQRYIIVLHWFEYVPVVDVYCLNVGLGDQNCNAS